MGPQSKDDENCKKTSTLSHGERLKLSRVFFSLSIFRKEVKNIAEQVGYYEHTQRLRNWT